MSLSPMEFLRRSEEFFANSYLTWLGVIQGVVLGLLMYKAVEIPYENHLGYMEVIGSFAVMILIVEEYHWFLLVIRRVPTFVDTFVPYALGGAQLAAVEFFGEGHGRWFLTTGILSSLGVLSYINAYRYCLEEDLFRECTWLRVPMLRIVEIDIMIVSIMACVLLATWITWDMISDSERVVSIGVFYGLIAITIGTSVSFLKWVTAEFERLNHVIPLLPLRGGR